MKEEKQMSVQAGLGMLAQGLSALFPEKAIDTKMITLPLTEYENLVNKASETYKDAKIKEMQSKIDELNKTILNWQTSYIKLEMRADNLTDENELLRNKVKYLERDVLDLKQNKHKWWQIWKRKSLQ